MTQANHDLADIFTDGAQRQCQPIDAGLEIVAAVVARTGKPVLVMTYANPIFRIGPEVFARRCREAGAGAPCSRRSRPRERFPGRRFAGS